jgi:hypothetical protein
MVRKERLITDERNERRKEIKASNLVQIQSVAWRDEWMQKQKDTWAKASRLRSPLEVSHLVTCSTLHEDKSSCLSCPGSIPMNCQLNPFLLICDESLCGSAILWRFL